MTTPKTPHRPSRLRRLAASVLASLGLAGGFVMAEALPAQAANYCGLDELDQNVFMVNDGLWSNPANWSRLHTPTSGESVCVPGGIVARVSNATTGLLGAQDGYITTLRVEGTIRIESGTTVGLATAIYGGSNLLNGGVIQVLNGSTLNLNADQNGAPAFQNVVGGSLIQVDGTSTALVRRPFVNYGTINLTGGGQWILDSGASGYSSPTNGTVIGGQFRMSNGTMTFGGSGAVSVLTTGGSVVGTIGSSQSLDVACSTFSGGINISQGLTNNGSIHFLPPLAGNCQMDYTLAGGATWTNNGLITFGNAGDPGSNSVRWGSNFFSHDGTIVNSATGSIVVNDYWAALEPINNAGMITINSGGFLGNVYYKTTNTGTIVNGGRCDLNELDNTGGTFELTKPCGIRTKATFSAGSTLRPHWNATELAKLTVGQSSPLAGTVNVVTDGTPPAPGVERDLITGPVTGTFGAVTSQSGAVGYTALYPSASLVKLRSGEGTGEGAISAIVPARLLDTRPDGTTTDGAGQAAGLQSPGSTITVQVTGRANIPADATAAVLNITVTQAQGPGFVTVWPCGSPQPTASSLNFAAGSTVPNGVIAKIGDAGTVCVYVSNGTQVLVDVTGYFTPSSPYAPLVPARLLDTRPGEVTTDGAGQGAGLVPAGGIVEVQVTDRAGVPANAAAAVLNVTVTGTEAPGFVTAFPCGSAQPTASSLNFTTGSTVPNNVIAKIGAGGKVCLFTSAGTHLIADVSGYFTAGAGFEAVAPARLLDSRPGEVTVDGAGQGAGAAAGGTITEVQITGRAGVPDTAAAAVLNVTVTQTQGPGFVTVFPCGGEPPTASSLNFGIGTTVPNGVISRIGTGGKVCLFASSGTHLIADLNGWFAG